MILRFNISIIIITSLLLFSCRSTKVATYNPGTDGTTESYIRAFSDIAVEEMKRTGIPASITLAQGIIESDMGRSRLAREANNHFGIKCHNGWTGPTVRHNDDRRNECFRKYNNADESYRDHSDFLLNGSRYDFLFELEYDDYKGWAKGLKKAGYATNPDYANMLIRKIEEYDLHKYDNKNLITTEIKPADQILPADTVLQVPEGKPVSGRVGIRSLPERVMVNNKVQYIIVKETDTRESIEDEMNLLSWELEKYNELPAGFDLVPGQVLYLQPKRDKAEEGKEYHTVKEGETMHSISQLYAVKVSKLYYMNSMKSGKQPKAGERIWLRTIKPVD